MDYGWDGNTGDGSWGGPLGAINPPSTKRRKRKKKRGVCDLRFAFENVATSNKKRPPPPPCGYEACDDDDEQRITNKNHHDGPIQTTALAYLPSFPSFLWASFEQRDIMPILKSNPQPSYQTQKLNTQKSQTSDAATVGPWNMIIVE